MRTWWRNRNKRTDVAAALAADAPCRRPVARPRVPAPLDVDPDQLVRRAGDDARAAADGGGAAARQPDADGLAKRRRDPAVRAVLAAGWRMARPHPQAPGLHRRRADDLALVIAERPAGVVGSAGCRFRGCTRAASSLGTVYTVAGSAAQIVLTQVVARERLVEAHAKNALASSGAEVAGPGIAGALIKARRRAARIARRFRAGDDLGADPARRRHRTSRQRAGAPRARGRSGSGPTSRPACASSRTSGCSSRSRSPSAPGRRVTRPRSSCRSCSRRARSASPSKRSG